jgi:hypothetical protein
MSTIQKVSPLLLAGALVGCGMGGGAKSAASVRDSAGIRIVENPDVAPAGLEWSFSQLPLLDIGGEGSPENAELFQVRQAVRLSDGRIVVANAGSSELKYFDPLGTYLASVGGPGEGPGEFREVRFMARFGGDSILVYDSRLLRVAVFDPDGAFTRNVQLETNAEIRFVAVRAAYRDGSMLASGFADVDEGVLPSGLQRYGSKHYHYAPDGSLLAELGVFDGTESYFLDMNGGFAVYPPFFGRGTQHLTWNDRLYRAANDSYEIQIKDPAGALQSIIRRDHAPISVQDRHVQLLREAQLAEATDDNRRRMANRALDDMPIPATMPAYSRAMVDDEGNIWVEAYRPPDVELVTWSVFAPDGVLQGELEGPPDFTPYQIGEDFMLGLWRDDFDLEHIQFYELRKAT